MIAFSPLKKQGREKNLKTKEKPYNITEQCEMRAWSGKPHQEAGGDAGMADLSSLL